MKFLRKLIVFIIAIIIAVYCYNRFKPEISDYLVSKGFQIPGITDDAKIFPYSQTVYDESGTENIVLTFPSEYMKDLSSEQLDSFVEGTEGMVSYYYQEDGSVAFTMTSEGRQIILDNLSTELDQSLLNNLIGGNIISISHNSDYTFFTVITDSSVTESELLTLTGKLIGIGKAYSSIEGEEDNNIHIDVLNNESGMITNAYDSDNLGEGIASDAINYATSSVEQGIDDLISNFSGGL